MVRRSQRHAADIDFRNDTDLNDPRLLSVIREGCFGWNTGCITVRIRYSRGADFSGTCLYTTRRIYVNLGRHLAYPYHMRTYLAKAVTVQRRWFKPECTVELTDAYQVVLFVFFHELYHLLVRRARRNPRQKESMCDRFAARFLVDRFGVTVRGPRGKVLPRTVWDFQDLDGFVAAACTRRNGRSAAKGTTASVASSSDPQLLLF